MALPKIFDQASEQWILKPLEIDVKPTELTIGEMRLMRGHIQFDENNPEAMLDAILIAAEYLIHHSNWTATEVNQLTAAEMPDVIKMVRGKEREAAVPLVNSVSSALGQEETPTESLTGQTT